MWWCSHEEKRVLGTSILLRDNKKLNPTLLLQLNNHATFMISRLKGRKMAEDGAFQNHTTSTSGSDVRNCV